MTTNMKRKLNTIKQHTRNTHTIHKKTQRHNARIQTNKQKQQNTNNNSKPPKLENKEQHHKRNHTYKTNTLKQRDTHNKIQNSNNEHIKQNKTK